MGCVCGRPEPSDESAVQVTRLRGNSPKSSVALVKFDPLEPSQQHLLRKSWAAFTKGDAVTSGMQIYIKLFTLDPPAANLFDFVEELSVEHLLLNDKLQAHVGRLLEHLDVAVNNLDDTHYLCEMAYNLGARHAVYGVRTDQFPEVVQGILHAFEHKLGVELTEEMVDAWSTLLDYYTQNMTAGFNSTIEK